MATLLGISLPSESKITDRVSTIRTSFIKAIIPEIKWKVEAVDNWRQILNLDTEPVRCCYCGNEATELDHFYPVVNNKKPTGYVSDLYNLVPCCAKCNQSKAGSNWKVWINGSAAKSPKTRNIQDLAARIETLSKYEEWIADKITKVDFSLFETDKSYINYFDDCTKLLETFQDYQRKAELIKKLVQEKIENAAK